MATFSYTAHNKRGEMQKGTVVAMDQSAAAANLNERGLTPILIKLDSGKKGGINLGFLNKFGGKVKLTDKMVFSRQFATMINAGIPISQSLSILHTQTTNKKLKEVLGDAAKKVEGGDPLSSALAEHPDVFSPIYINMVKAGEAGGMLDEVLERLAVQMEKDAEIVSKIRSAMIYPSILTVVTFGAFAFLMVFLVPRMASIFEGLNTELPWYTKLMMGISSFLVNYGLYLVVGIVFGVIMLLRYRKTEKGRRFIDKLLLKLPVFGEIVVKVNVARFARTFGSLMSSGLSVLDALNTTATALGNSVFQDAIRSISKDVKAGKTIAEPLKSMTIFPPIVSQMVAVGEETGQLDKILIKLAGFYEKEVDSMVSGITSIIEPILIVTLGGLVGFIVVGVFGPLSQLSNAV